jgi:dipeptidyl-peptidase 4
MTVSADQPLTPERVFSSPGLAGPSPRGVAISPDGAWVTWLAPSPADQHRLDLRIAPVAGGEGRRLVAADAVEGADATLSEEEKSRRERLRIAQNSGVTAYEWDEQSARLLIPAAAGLFVADVRTGAIQALDIGEGEAFDARISPRGGYIAFVRAQNLHLLELSSGIIRPLTTIGGGSVSCGMAEFVAQEEMGRYTGYWLSPDEQSVAYAQVDENPVELINRLEVGPSGAVVMPQRYPRAGGQNVRIRLFVRPLAVDAVAVEINLGSETDIYLARVAWSPDSTALFVQRQSRDQAAVDLMRANPATGESVVILSERQKPWINLTDDFRPLADGTFIWGSARSGAHQIYLHGKDGALIRAITAGPSPHAGGAGGGGLRAPGLVGVDEVQGLAYVMAGVPSPIERHLFVVSYRDPGPPRRLTGGSGWWTAVMPRSARAFVGYYSDPATPPQAALYDVEGRRLRWIEENAPGPGHPFHPYAARYPEPEFGVLAAADGQDLHYVLLRPAGFNPSRRYPAIIDVYGGPGVQTVTRSWRRASEKLLLEAGYVVFALDNRGSSGRDVAFETAIDRRLGSVEVDDQIAGLNLLRSLPFVDPARVGVMGWSYGGYMTLRLMTDPRARFRCGAAGAAPTDWREYDTHYTERYMGRPQDDPAAYDAAAVIPRLDRLEGRLLLLHGMADDNVLASNAYAVMAALQALGQPFDLMLYPGQRHGVAGEMRQLQLWRTYLEFFARELAA